LDARSAGNASVRSNPKVARPGYTFPMDSAPKMSSETAHPPTLPGTGPIAPKDATTPPTGRAVAAAPSSRPIGSPPARRAVGRTIAGATLLAALVALTGWNATRSPALIEAREAEASDDLTNAIRAALDHLDRRPWSREACLIAARCLSKLDFGNEAEPYYRRAKVSTLEDLHHRAYGLVRSNLRDRADAAYREILAKWQNDVTSLRIKAGVHLARRHWDNALDVADHLIGISSGPAPAFLPVAVGDRWKLKSEEVVSPAAIGYAIQGIVNHDLLWFESAAASFERALELDPNLRSIPLGRSLFWTHLAEDLLITGRATDCRVYLTRATREADDPALLELLGRAYYQEGSNDDAERCWRRTLELAPRHYGALMDLASLEMDRGRPEESIPLLTRAVEVKPDSYPARYSLGLACRRLGRLDEARRFEEQAGQLRQGPEKDARTFIAPTDRPKP
jgi:tetratricopeptide (TPR) repeat protein